ncbi:MAG: hypothetical protein R3D90_16600 [Paracoccaceae bacterium]
MEALLRREIGYEVDFQSVRWVTGRGDTGRGDPGRGDTGRGDTGRGEVGPFRALVFYAAPLHPGTHVALTLDEQVRRLARAAGHMGSCAAYLRNTVQHLEALGIRDRYLWELQRRVAEEIAGLPEGQGWPV